MHPAPGYVRPRPPGAVAATRETAIWVGPKRPHCLDYLHYPCFSFVGDTWIKPAVKNIHDQVEENNDDAVEKHNAKHQRIVAIQSSVDKETPQAGDSEYLFDNDRTRQY